MWASTWTGCSAGPTAPGPASPSTTSSTPIRLLQTPARARRPHSPPWAACSSSTCASSSRPIRKSPVPQGRGFFLLPPTERLEDQFRHGVIVAQLALDEGVEGDGIAGLAGYIRIDGMGQARRKQEDLVLGGGYRGDGGVVAFAPAGGRPQADLFIAGLGQEGHGRAGFGLSAIIEGS